MNAEDKFQLACWLGLFALIAIMTAAVASCHTTYTDAERLREHEVTQRMQACLEAGGSSIDDGRVCLQTTRKAP